VKIIRPPEDNFTYKFTCSKCTAVLEADADDVKVGRLGTYGEYERCYYVECTFCQTPHRLDSTKLNIMTRQLADKKEKK